MRILITRTAADCDRTIALLEARGHEGYAAPAIEMTCRVPSQTAIRKCSYWLATSANAIFCLKDNPDWPLFCERPFFVAGNHTADSARKAGARQVVKAEHTAIALAHHIIVNPLVKKGQGYYAAGAVRKPDLEDMLSQAKISFMTDVIYDVASLPFPPEHLSDRFIRSEIDALFLTSAMSAKRIFTAFQQANLDVFTKPLLCLCISKTVADFANGAGYHHCAIAMHPTIDCMIDLVDICSKEEKK